MPTTELWAAALSMLLRHDMNGCARSALHAAGLLDRIAEHPGLDSETRALCEQASLRLARQTGG